MKRHIVSLSFLALLIALAACSGTGMMSTAKPAGHPPLSEQEMLIACSACHQDVTPDVYAEWYASTHGIGNVKCYQCHGTYENLRVAPEMEISCGACHADKLGDHTGNRLCWECHAPHNFRYAE